MFSNSPGASETLYYLIVNDANGNRLAVIQDYSSIECAKAVNGVGALTFVVSSTNYPLDTFKVDGLVELWRASKGGSARLEFQQVWFIRERYKVIAGNVRQWKIVAYDLNFLLSNPNGDKGRIVAYPVDFSPSAASLTDAYTDKMGAADDMLKQIARENIGSSVVDTNRNLTSYYFGVQANTTLGATIHSQMARRNLLKLFQEICQASTTVGTYLAWDILCTVPPNSGGAIAFELRTYTAQRGIDHRVSSDQPVLIGPDFGNLDNIELGFINTDEANYIYAGGKGEEAVRLTTTASDTNRINISPYNRREMWLDASQTDGPVALQDAADAALRTGRPVIYLTGQLIDTDQARYGIHWNWGDYVTAQVDGYSFDCRLDLINLSYMPGSSEAIDVRIQSDIGIAA
jgi:ReqiPepy6 Gp37-like protein